MSQDAPELIDRPLAGVRQYQIVGATALAVMAMPLLARNAGLWSLLPLAVGAAAMFLSWRAGPYLVLGSILFLVLCDAARMTPLDFLTGMLSVCLIPMGGRPGRPPLGAITWRLEESSPLLDAILAAGLVAYLNSAFRLLGVQKNILPADPRRRIPLSKTRQDSPKRRRREFKYQLRSESLVRPQESIQILLLSLGTAAFALVLGWWLEQREAGADLAGWDTEGVYASAGDSTWRLMVLSWLVGTLLLVVSGTLAYAGMSRATAQEASLYLQDQVWKETRREQSRISRWLAWARLRRKGP